jgi:HK97 gp10 family phage protein
MAKRGKSKPFEQDYSTGVGFYGIKETIEKIEQMISMGQPGKPMYKAAKEVYIKAALVVRDEARRRAPVKTGALKKSIFAAHGNENKPNALVGVNYRIAPHAHLIEYGSMKNRPYPFFRPGISASANEVKKIIETGLKKIVEDAASGRN